MKDKEATVIVDLTPTEEEILKNLDKDARWGINRALKEGLTIEESEDFESFYDIYKNNIAEAGVRSETIETIIEHTTKLFLCKKEGVVIAGAVLRLVEGIPKLDFAASLPDFRKYQPNNLLYWQCIVWSKKNNYDKLDLGGWQINARDNLIGVNKFKERWGKVVYSERDFPFLKAIGRKLVRNFRFFWWLNKKLRLLLH
jgi:lipid II:glycine glycyltransferase (peptidoglycan interpeptide bridge formation enzyme)